MFELRLIINYNTQNCEKVMLMAKICRDPDDGELFINSLNITCQMDQTARNVPSADETILFLPFGDAFSTVLLGLNLKGKLQYN